MDTTTTHPETAAPEPQPRGTALATVGLLMAAAGPILMIAATLVFGLDTDDAAFFAVPSVLGLAGAALMRRRSTAARVVAVVMALAVAVMLFWTAFGLFLPASFFDFVPGVLVLPGSLLAVVAGITSVRAAKRDRPVGPGERRTATVVLAGVGVLALASAVLTVAGRDTVDAEAAANADLTVDMADFEFDRASYDVPAGGTVLVRNSDPFAHTFTVEALGVDVDLGPDSEKLVTLPDSPGTYVLICEPHTSDAEDPSADDMAAEITVG